jgi:hypothetical protein
MMQRLLASFLYVLPDWERSDMTNAKKLSSHAWMPSFELAEYRLGLALSILEPTIS